MAQLQFLKSDIIYTIPQQINLSPKYTLDEMNEVYRIVIGAINSTEEEQKQYDKLFTAIEERADGFFINGFILTEDDTILSAEMAAFSKVVFEGKSIYDIEISICDGVFSKKGIETNDISGRSIITKDKKINRKRKTTSKK